MSEPDTLTPLSERISGPFKGCFVATYAVAAPGGFLAYAKLCGRAPESVWSCDAFAKVGSKLSESPEAAVIQAEARARESIDHRVQQGYM